MHVWMELVDDECCFVVVSACVFSTYIFSHISSIRVVNVDNHSVDELFIICAYFVSLLMRYTLLQWYIKMLTTMKNKTNNIHTWPIEMGHITHSAHIPHQEFVVVEQLDFSTNIFSLVYAHFTQIDIAYKNSICIFFSFLLSFAFNM